MLNFFRPKMDPQTAARLAAIRDRAEARVARLAPYETRTRQMPAVTMAQLVGAAS